MTNNSATEAAAGKADIVERLKYTAYMGTPDYAILAEAATEIASLRERYLQSQTDLQNAYGDRDEAIKQQVLTEARAETAERNHQRDVETFQRHGQTLRDNGINSHSEAVVIVVELRRKLAKAMEALKPFAAIDPFQMSFSKRDGMVYCVDYKASFDNQLAFAHFRAARAITEEK